MHRSRTHVETNAKSPCPPPCPSQTHYTSAPTTTTGDAPSDVLYCPAQRRRCLTLQVPARGRRKACCGSKTPQTVVSSSPVIYISTQCSPRNLQNFLQPKPSTALISRRDPHSLEWPPSGYPCPRMRDRRSRLTQWTLTKPSSAPEA